MIRSLKPSFGRIALTVAACAALAFSLVLAGCAGDASKKDTGTDAAANSAASADAASSGSSGGAPAADSYGPATAVELKVKGYEPITIDVFGEQAPATAENFLNLVKEGYYNGKSFYRIVDDFCLQGGTLGNKAAGNDPSLSPIKGEFSGNGVANALADNFGRGVVAMARTTNPNSATSTFFVTLGDGVMVESSLNGQYAAFGLIDDAGMKTIDKIVADYLPKVDEPGMGAITKEANQPIIESIKVIG